MGEKTTIGIYGPWAASLAAGGPLELSLRRGRFKSIAAWRKKALAKALELVAAPADSKMSDVRVGRRYEYDGLSFEEISWQLQAGPRTEAVFVKPAGARGRLPAVLALHDHGGQKYFGYKKIVRTGPHMHPVIAAHQKGDYEDTAWVNEIAKRGYAVLAHDTFAFGSRRVLYKDVLDAIVGKSSTLHQQSGEISPRRGGRKEPRIADAGAIAEYNSFAGAHESVMAKSLFCAGTTWPGVTFSEDKRALDYLLSRKDVDPSRVACCGLSGGGLRTVYLAGLDHRVKAAVCVGFMSTWRDFLLYKTWTHTWMTYTPLMPKYLDFPEIFALRAPLPSLVLSCTEDPLYTVPEMKRADSILKAVFKKAGAPGNYRTVFYPGGHKFDRAMQRDAFDWLESLLR